MGLRRQLWGGEVWNRDQVKGSLLWGPSASRMAPAEMTSSLGKSSQAPGIHNSEGTITEKVVGMAPGLQRGLPAV